MPESRSSSIRDLTRAAVATLATADARAEVDLLLGHVLGRDRAWLFAHDDVVPSEDQAARFRELVIARAGGTPIAYLLGTRDFWTLSLNVSPAVLIPRPETELLVELAIARADAPEQCRVLDLGTGSGAIALAIATQRPRWSVTATDASDEALTVARANAASAGLEHVRFVAGDWYAAVKDARFDLIVSNPPYIRADDHHLREGDLRFEPMHALASGPDGLDDLRRIVAGAPAHLASRGWLGVEHGHDQGADVRALFDAAGFRAVVSARDLAGHERVTHGEWRA